LEAKLEQSKTVWEVTTYAHAGHGFTHPEDGSDHFHYEKAAEQRSWTSMASFVDKAWEHQDKAGQLNVSSCGLMQTKDEEMGSTDTTSSCSDDNAAVAAAAGSWGITECRQDLCTGQYADMMKPMCSKTCGLCTTPSTSCDDDNAAVAAAAGSWGITECRQDLCTGQYADMMKPMCKKTCGLCSTPSTACSDDDAAVAAAAGSWGITKCSQDLCTGQYADMIKPMCKKTCGLCDTGDAGGLSLTCGEVKKLYKQSNCCGQPQKPFACSDDDAAVAAAAGSWGITNCSQDLCTGQYADMMKPMCKKTCGLCDTGDAGGLSLTCGEVKKLYKQSNCCGQPQKPFTPNRRLTDSELNR